MAMMKNMSWLSRRPRVGYRFASALALGLAMVAAGVSGPGGAYRSVSAQTPNPCALLTTDEVRSLAGNASVSDGVPSSLPSFGSMNCRYTWGAGTGRFELDVNVYDASGRFPGMSADQMKPRLLESVKPGTAETVISDVGEAAVFKSDSPYYATATALLKGRILEVRLDGLEARGEKDRAIALLKTAVSRL
jgi:hypothetical protein